MVLRIDFWTQKNSKVWLIYSHFFSLHLIRVVLGVVSGLVQLSLDPWDVNVLLALETRYPTTGPFTKGRARLDGPSGLI